MKIGVTYTADFLMLKAKAVALQLGGQLLPLDWFGLEGDAMDILLSMTPSGLTLQLKIQPSLQPLQVDFLQGSVGYRCQYGGGRHCQLLARAVGLHKKRRLRVLDVTAGLGNDAVLLAYLGAQVTMVERSPVVAALLVDALERARQNTAWKDISLQLEVADASHYLLQLPEAQRPDVIYLDPMYPEHNRSALNKKEMRILRYVVGDDIDAQQLFERARTIARGQVVVKRPRLALTIDCQKPDWVLLGKSSRFDVYRT